MEVQAFGRVSEWVCQTEVREEELYEVLQLFLGGRQNVFEGRKVLSVSASNPCWLGPLWCVTWHWIHTGLEHRCI